jgi:hypothetical protein
MNVIVMVYVGIDKEQVKNGRVAFTPNSAISAVCHVRRR